MTLRELPQARKVTQVRIAKKRRTTQGSVSPLEKRSELLLLTLRNAVEAMGGNLSLVAEFPDCEPLFCPALPKTIRGQSPRVRETRSLEVRTAEWGVTQIRG
jgi:hypothetical protein